MAFKIPCLILAFAVLFSFADRAEGRCCPHGWARFQGSCYHANPNTAMWHHAKSQCAALGAHLVKITSQAENDFVLYMSNTAAPAKAQMWIGLHYNTTEQRFIWEEDNSCPVYTNWRRGEPNNAGGKEYCTWMYTSRCGSGDWNDHHCRVQVGYPYGFICEKKAH